MIKFSIVKSKLLHNPTGYAARVIPARTVDFAGLVDRVADSNTSVTKSDALSVLEDYHRIIEKLLCDGMNVLTPHAHYHVSMKGTFNDEADTYDASRHQLLARITPGPRLRKALRDVQVEKELTEGPRPWPLTYVDVTSGERNGLVTPGGHGRVVGQNLAFDPADPLQGVFFLSATGGETRVAELAWIMPGHLIFNIPALAAGEYQLEVRAAWGNPPQVRTGTLDQVLTVA